MTFLILILLVALIVVARTHAKAPTPQTWLILTIVASLVFVLFCVRTLRGCRGANPTSRQPTFEHAAALRLGEKIKENRLNNGTIVVLQWQGVDSWSARIAREQLDGLKDGMGTGEYHLEVEGPTLPSDREALQSILLGGARMDPDELWSWIDAHKEVSAVVSFISLDPILGKIDPKDLPPLFVKDSALTPAMQELIEGGYVLALVLEKSGVNRSADAPRRAKPDEIFRLRYELIEPAPM